MPPVLPRSPVTFLDAAVFQSSLIDEFDNKESYAVELARFKERLKFIVDSMDSIIKDPNVSIADRIKSESVKSEALAMLRDATEAAISSPDPHSALKKIFERSSRRTALE